MACEFNYAALASISDRMALTLRRMRDANVPQDLATALVALSEGETNVTWNLNRPQDDDCCGQIIGIERGVFNRSTAGEEEVLAWLASKGWVAWAEPNVVPAGGLDNPLQPQRAMLYFEYLMAHNNMAAAHALSIGPTQIWLGNSPGLCGVPQTREEAWAFYVASDMREIVFRHLRYLVPQRYANEGCLSTDFPLPAGGDESLPWLQRHAGSANVANQVLNGGPLFPNRRPFRASWSQASGLASSIYQQ